MNEPSLEQVPAITELSRRQRRVLGVLVEKAFTTPEYYPMTLKAVTAGCNQKSNREPVVNFSEDDVTDTLEELRQLGLVAEVHTESGRTLRYRHYMRKRFTLTEPQLAVIIELLLRGRQTLGELRGRASRMVPIESLEDLRTEVTGLMRLGLVWASDDLERRGVEVDHNLYPPQENPDRARAATSFPPQAVPQRAASSDGPTVADRRPMTERPAPTEGRVHRADDEHALESMRGEIRRLREELESTQEQLRQLFTDFRQFRDQLGG